MNYEVFLCFYERVLLSVSVAMPAKKKQSLGWMQVPVDELSDYLEKLFAVGDINGDGALQQGIPPPPPHTMTPLPRQINGAEIEYHKY